MNAFKHYEFCAGCVPNFPNTCENGMFAGNNNFRYFLSLSTKQQAELTC